MATPHIEAQKGETKMGVYGLHNENLQEKQGEEKEFPPLDHPKIDLDLIKKGLGKGKKGDEIPPPYYYGK